MALVLVVGDDVVEDLDEVGESGDSGGDAVAFANCWTALETLNTVLSSNLSSSS